MVRRAAAQNLGKIAEAMEQEYISRELVPIFHDLTQDGALMPD
jgi:HEAT repeat protein